MHSSVDCNISVKQNASYAQKMLISAELTALSGELKTNRTKFPLKMKIIRSEEERFSVICTKWLDPSTRDSQIVKKCSMLFKQSERL